MDTTITEREIIINEDLEFGDISTWGDPIENLVKTFRGSNIVRTVVSGKYTHYTFIEYLKMAYDNHKGLIIKPDFIWHTVLYELSQLIIADPEKYRDFFTTTEGKQKITVPTNDPQLIDLQLIIDILHELVPTDTRDYLLDFSTTDELSKMAINAAFCEAVSPFYDYGMFMCGIPKMKILGTEEDWDKIKTSCENLKETFSDHTSYFDGVINLVDKFNDGTDIEYLGQIFNSQREGSGSKLHIDGWVKDLFADKTHTKYKEMPRQLSSVKYEFLNTGQNFKLHCGLFSSNLEDDYLVPEYGYLIEEL